MSLQELKNHLLKKIKEDDRLSFDMIQVMKNAQEMLKEIDLFNTKSELEIIRNKNYKKIDLWENEVIYYSYFFITMLGFMDAKIDNTKRNISFFGEFSGSYTYDSQYYKNELNKNNDFMLGVLFDRDELIEDYKNINIKHSSYSDLFLEVISSQPSYKKFNDLYVDSIENSTEESIQQQFINAYNIGYMNRDKDYFEVYDMYKKLLDDLIKNIQYNLEEVSIQKGMQKKRK